VSSKTTFLKLFVNLKSGGSNKANAQAVLRPADIS